MCDGVYDVKIMSLGTGISSANKVMKRKLDE